MRRVPQLVRAGWSVRACARTNPAPRAGALPGRPGTRYAPAATSRISAIHTSPRPTRCSPHSQPGLRLRAKSASAVCCSPPHLHLVRVGGWQVIWQGMNRNKADPTWPCMVAHLLFAGRGCVGDIVVLKAVWKRCITGGKKGEPKNTGIFRGERSRRGCIPRAGEENTGIFLDGWREQSARGRGHWYFPRGREH